MLHVLIERRKKRTQKYCVLFI